MAEKKRLTGCPYFIPDIFHLGFTIWIHFHRWESMVNIDVSSSTRHLGSRCQSGRSCSWSRFFADRFTSEESRPSLNSRSPSFRPLVGPDRLCYGRRCCAHSPQTKLGVDSLVILFISVGFIYGWMALEKRHAKSTLTWVTFVPFARGGTGWKGGAMERKEERGIVQQAVMLLLSALTSSEFLFRTLLTPWHLSITITNKYLFMLCNIRYLDILTNRAFNSKSCQSHTCQWFSIKLLHLEQQPILCSILKDRQDFQAQITQSPERKSFFGIGAKWDNYTYAKHSWSFDELVT